MSTDCNDPFDLKNLRISQEFAKQVEVKRVLASIPVRKPDRQWFVRVHPAADMALTTMLLESSDDRAFYLVSRDLWETLGMELRRATLFLAVTSTGNVFLWPVKLPTTDGRQDSWSRSALEAVARAQTSWLRVTANLSLGEYEIYEARSCPTDPVFPDLSLPEILRIAFKDRHIDSMSHTAVRKLTGELP
jgi:hypothetical protein